MVAQWTRRWRHHRLRPRRREAHADLLESLGPHTTGVGCIYLKDLGDVDLDVLETIVARSYAALTAATSSGRALGGTHR